MANTVLSVFNLQKTFELEPIFAGVSFQINEGEKVALVGVNGAGKTTLLEIIAGLDTADTGHGAVVKARGLRVVYLPQEVSGFGDITGDHHLAPETTLWDAMLDVMGDVRELQREMHRLEEEMSDKRTPTHGPVWDRLMREYEGITQRFELYGGYELEHRIEQTLEGLGFRPSQFDLAIGVMSGGQKTRAALARTLLRGPDLLLLDEPTNHLDLSAIEWLETFLATWGGTLLAASHDRRFLDRVTTRTLDLDFGRLEDYPGNYTRYLRLKAERMERRLIEYQAQQAEIGRTAEYIRRYKAGQRSREAKGRAKRLERVVRLQAPRSPDQIRLDLHSHLRSGLTVLALEDLVVGYRLDQGSGIRDQGSASPNGTHLSMNGRTVKENHVPHGELALVQCPDVELERSERAALIGPNGSGKTTLLRTVIGDLPPLHGEVELGHNVTPAYYAQAHEGLDAQRTVLEEIQRARSMSEEAARTLLGRFLFSGDDVFKKIADLSGGERSRVALAKLTLADANFLVLDEPTNHLDLGSREALEDVLGDYRGTLLFVSHDRAFIDALATQVWVVDEGRLEVFDGNYTDYQDELRRRRDMAAPAPAPAKPGGPGKPGPNGRPLPGDQAARKAQRAQEEAERAAAKARATAQRQVQALEGMIAQLEDQINLLSAELEAASGAQDVALVAELGREYQQLADELQRKYADWETLAAAAQL